MRLTLRTLLAWLDDQLPPADVKEIGEQVSQTPFARDLVERIHRVSRERRVSVPSGPNVEANDPNVVAAYLDNALPPEKIADFEKRCLASDAHLAEVAGVHQVLSMLGHKAKVSADARYRMYRLINGRESLPPPTAAIAPSPPPEPLTEPITTWRPPAIPARPLFERVGIVAAVVFLMGILCWTAYLSLRPEEGRSAGPGFLVLKSADSAEGKSPPSIPRAPEKTEQIALAPPPPSEKIASIVETPPPISAIPRSPATERPEPEVAKPAATTKPQAPTGPVSVATLTKTTGVLLRKSGGQVDWKRLSVGDPLLSGDRLLGLEPYRSTLKSEAAEIATIGECELDILDHQKSEAAAMRLIRGRASLRGSAPGLPFILRTNDSLVRITPPPGAVVGIERRDLLERGRTEPVESRIFVRALEGEVLIETDGGKTSLKGPASASIDVAGKRFELFQDPSPDWLTRVEPTAYEKQIGERLLKHIVTDRPLLYGLAVALDRADEDVSRFSLKAFGAIGSAEMVVPVLNSSEHSAETRGAAALVLRDLLARDQASRRSVNLELARVLGQEWAEVGRKLIVGFSPAEARDEATGRRLVADLESPVFGIRDLTIAALKELTGRDSLEYDPATHTDRSIQAWRDILRKKEFFKEAVPPKAKEAAAAPAKSEAK